MNKNFIFKSEGLKQDSLFFLVRASSGTGQTSEPSTDCYSEPFLFPRCVERLDIPWQRNTEHLISFLLHTSQVIHREMVNKGKKIHCECGVSTVSLNRAKPSSGSASL